MVSSNFVILRSWCRCGHMTVVFQAKTAFFFFSCSKAEWREEENTFITGQCAWMYTIITVLPCQEMRKEKRWWRDKNNTTRVARKAPLFAGKCIWTALTNGAFHSPQKSELWAGNDTYELTTFHASVVVVSVVSPYPRITPRYVIDCAWKHKKNMLPNTVGKTF